MSKQKQRKTLPVRYREAGKKQINRLCLKAKNKEKENEKEKN